jgi:prophage regulatory protein
MGSRFIRLPEVIRRTSHSRSSIYQLIGRGEFPRPIRIGLRSVAWVECDIDGYIEARILASRGDDK